MEKRYKYLQQHLFSDHYAQKEQILHQAFFLFAMTDQKILERITHYILTGNDPDIITFLDTTPKETLLFTMNRMGEVKKSKDKMLALLLLETHKGGHNAFFDVWTTVFSDDEIIRFGKILSTKLCTKGLYPQEYIAPDWFKALLSSALLKETMELIDQPREHINVADFARLFTKTGENPQQLLGALFQQSSRAIFNANLCQALYLCDGLEAYLQQQIDVLMVTIAHTTEEVGAKQVLVFFHTFPAIFNLITPEIFATHLFSPDKAHAKTMRAMLGLLEKNILTTLIRPHLMAGNGKAREVAIEIVGSVLKDRGLLTDALASESSKKLQEKIQSHLLNIGAQPVEVISYVLPILPVILPEIKSLPNSVLAGLKARLCVELEEFRQDAEEEIADNKANLKAGNQFESFYRQEQYQTLQQVTEKTLESCLAYINGNQATFPELKKITFAQSVLGSVLETSNLLKLSEFSLVHYLRACQIIVQQKRLPVYALYDFTYTKVFHNLDLRYVAYLFKENEVTPEPVKSIAHHFLQDSGYGSETIFDGNDQDTLWPFFYEHSQFIEEGLGILPPHTQNAYQQLSLVRTLTVLEKFPAIPPQWVPRLLDIALGSQKTGRVMAQKVLMTVPNIHERVAEALPSSQQEIRIVATEWLVALRHRASLRPLLSALKREKREAVYATLLSAVEAFGKDISGYLTADVLLKEAQAGLKGKIPAGFGWFDRAVIPPLKWHSGDTVHPDIVYYWVVLAVKLKMPEGNGLFKRYLSLLDQRSQEALGVCLLQSFIAQDTICPTEAEALALAQQEAPALLADYHRIASRYVNQDWAQAQLAMTLEDVIKQIKTAKLANYLGSAIKEKGMLALIAGIDGVSATAIVAEFLKKHFKRRAQIEAILMALANSEDPLIVQQLLAIARRYRTQSVQELARTLVAMIGERNGWSADELADRTIATAGLDDHGVLMLDYGERTFTAQLNEKDQLILLNDERKIIKALPDAHKGEDETLVKESKQLFANSKKELKQVITQQTERLYEAMCVERIWPEAEWQTYLHAHPIMKRLIERLIWLNVDDKGQILQVIRPAGDGTLLAVDDSEVRLPAHSFVKVAHYALMDQGMIKAWLGHLKDYKIKPLFTQLCPHPVAITTIQDGTVIEDRLGWMVDTFTLRTHITKRGYQQGAKQDAGFFDQYTKRFATLGIYSVIKFTGSCVPEENRASALLSLSFYSSLSWHAQAMEIERVPPVLLAECFADYLLLAEKGTGFDPAWERKSDW